MLPEQKQSIIDVHSHPQFDNRGKKAITKKLKAHGFPYVEERGETLFFVSPLDIIDRPVEHDLINPKLMLEKMSMFNIVHQLKLASPWTFKYEMKDKDAVLWLAQTTNDKIIEDWVGPYPSKFSGACTIPMQFPDMAIAELERCAALGYSIVTIGTTVNQEPLHLEKFDPIWKKIYYLGMNVYVHPQEMTDEEENWFRWTDEMPYRTARAMSSFMVHGILDRFPHLKVIFSHGASDWLANVGRRNYAHKVRPDLIKKDPMRHFEKIMFDSHLCDQSLFKYVIDKYGCEQTFYGADSPFALGDWPSKYNPDQIPGQSIMDTDFGPQDSIVKHCIFMSNARKVIFFE